MFIIHTAIFQVSNSTRRLYGLKIDKFGLSHTGSRSETSSTSESVKTVTVDLPDVLITGDRLATPWWWGLTQSFLDGAIGIKGGKVWMDHPAFLSSGSLTPVYPEKFIIGGMAANGSIRLAGGLVGRFAARGAQPIKSLGAAAREFSKVKIPKGLKQVKDFGYQHGQKVYKYKGKYYSRDIDGHNGGVWKVFENIGGRLKRKKYDL